MTALSIGALCPPLHEQIGCAAEVVKNQQRAVDSMIFLYVRGYLTESDHDKIGWRIVKDLKETLARKAKE